MVGSVCTFCELKSPKWKQPLNISVFYKQSLEYHRPSKFLCQTSGRQNHWFLLRTGWGEYQPEEDELLLLTSPEAAYTLAIQLDHPETQVPGTTTSWPIPNGGSLSRSQGRDTVWWKNHVRLRIRFRIYVSWWIRAHLLKLHLTFLKLRKRPI
jgi:hypothetical protein